MRRALQRLSVWRRVSSSRATLVDRCSFQTAPSGVGCTCVEDNGRRPACGWRAVSGMGDDRFTTCKTCWMYDRQHCSVAIASVLRAVHAAH